MKLTSADIQALYAMVNRAFPNAGDQRRAMRGTLLRMIKASRAK